MCRYVDGRLACEPLHGHHLAHRPPTPAQLDSLCAETAAIARSWGWTADAISIQSVMTHAEAASNRDGRVMHNNDGPMVEALTVQIDQHGRSVAYDPLVLGERRGG